ncbi:MAG: oxidoreductase [Frankiales bacterium]|nr:oxidoreductase [Frankiales bacterium]
MTSADLPVALVGYGLAGRYFHAPVLSAVDGLVLTTIVTASPERAAAARHDFPEAQVVADWEQADRPGLVVLATPNRTHASLALGAIAAGLPVVVDKPLARDVPEGETIAQAARTAGVPLTVFHNRRWDSDVRTAHKLLAEGALGRPHRLETRFERWRPQPGTGWRESADYEEGGGLLLDLGSHQVDVAVHLLGPVTTVYAELDQRRPGARVEDDVMLALTHASGARSTHWLSATAAHRGPRLRLLGSQAAYVVEDLDGQEAALRAGARPADGWGEVPESRWGVLTTGDTSVPVPSVPGDYRLFYAGVLEGLRGNGPLPVTAEEAVHVLAVLDAARVSARERRLVDLPPPD